MKRVVGNFKMNLTKQDIEEYLNQLETKEFNHNKVIFCPSNIYLNEFIQKGFITGSQDIAAFENGSYTGEISGIQLDSMGVMYTIIGHSERRTNFYDNEFVPLKVKNAVNNNLKPILCIGESLVERNNGETTTVLEREIDEGFSLINNVDIENVTLAYEPIWSIGTNKILEPEQLQEIVYTIKEYVFNKYDMNIEVLYGGSVNLTNIDELEKVGNLDGYLVGGLSLDANKFIELTKKIG